MGRMRNGSATQEGKKSRVLAWCAFAALSCYWTWVSLIFFNDSFWHGDEGALQSFWIGCTVIHSLALFACVLFRKLIVRVFSKGRVCLVPAVLVVLGTLALAFAPPVLAGVALFAGIMLVSLGSAVLVLLLGVLCCHTHPFELVMAVLGSYVVMGVLRFVADGTAFLLMASCLVVLPLACALFVMLAQRGISDFFLFESAALSLGGRCHRKPTVPCQDGKGESAGSDKPNHEPRRRRLLVAIPLATLFFYSLCGEFLRSLSLRLPPSLDLSMGCLYHLGGAAGALAALVCLAAFHARNPEDELLCNVGTLKVVLVATASALVLSLVPGFPYPLAYGVFAAGFHCLRAYVWIFAVQVVCRYGVSSILCTGFTQASISLASFFGTLVASSIPLLGAQGLVSWGILAPFLLLVLFACALLLTGERWFDSAWGLLRIDNPDDPRSQEGAGNYPSRFTCIVDRFKLTKSETEVAMLLARGRSLPYIEEKLYISKSTAQTHRKHIYAKMGVTNRQEFLTLVETSFHQLHEGR